MPFFNGTRLKTPSASKTTRELKILARLCKTLKNSQRISKTHNDTQRLSKTLKDDELTDIIAPKVETETTTTTKCNLERHRVVATVFSLL